MPELDDDMKTECRDCCYCCQCSALHVASLFYEARAGCCFGGFRDVFETLWTGCGPWAQCSP